MRLRSRPQPELQAAAGLLWGWARGSLLAGELWVESLGSSLCEPLSSSLGCSHGSSCFPQSGHSRDWVEVTVSFMA